VTINQPLLYSQPSLAHNPVQYDRTKHAKMDKHYIKEKLDTGLICQPYVSTQSTCRYTNQGPEQQQL